MRHSKTHRGFAKIDFQDLGGKLGSVQESSAAIDGGAIWIGLEEGVHIDCEGKVFCSASAHIDRDTAKRLAEILAYFASTGRLPEDGTR